MAKKKASQAGLRALKQRYGAELDELRKRYEAEASELTRQHRAAESDYQIMTRQFRKDVAGLKRLGLAPDVDARKARPTSTLGRLLNAVQDFATGGKPARATKVKPETARKLKREGYTVINNRVLTSSDRTVRKGEVVTREEGPAKPVRRVRLTANVEQQAQRVFATLQPGQMVGVDWGEGRFSELFGPGDEAAFVAYIYKYQPADLQGMNEAEPFMGKSKTLTVLDFNSTQVREQMRDRARAEVERDRARRKVAGELRKHKRALDAQVRAEGYTPKRPVDKRPRKGGRARTAKGKPRGGHNR